MDLGNGSTCGHGSQEGRDGSRPPAASWMFAVLICKL
jgi:hypothetical protein